MIQFQYLDSFLKPIKESLYDFDVGLFRNINQVWTNEYFNFFFPAITDLHRGWFFKFIFVPWLLFVFLRQYQKKGIAVFFFLLLAAGTSDLIGGQIIKPAFERERPATAVSGAIVRSVHHGGFSFTSNHASNSVAAAVFLSQWLPQGRVLFWVLALLVAYSRIYNGVHYPSDVFFGMVVGFVVGSFYSQIAKKIIRPLS